MKRSEVPQDQDPSFEGHKKICYAVDTNGRFVKIQTSGWQAEQTVKEVAWQSIEKNLELMRQKVAQGQASPLHFFMLLRQMDPPLLAKNMGVWRWRVKWHMRPNVFRKLKTSWLERYADCLEISVPTLKNYVGTEWSENAK